MKVLIGNKADLYDMRQVSSEDARELAAQHKMEYFETSAKTRENIDNLSQHIFSSIYKKLFGMSTPSQPGDPAHSEAGPSNKNNGSVVISRLS
jgi:GTPase SAR1 family protein